MPISVYRSYASATVRGRRRGGPRGAAIRRRRGACGPASRIRGYGCATVVRAPPGRARSLANAVAAQGITVNSLLPGRIATPRARQINEAAAARSGIPVADVEQSSTGEIPAGRYGEPDEFGDGEPDEFGDGESDEFGAVAAFLCSARASYVTGAALRCDGGLVPTL